MREPRCCGARPWERRQGAMEDCHDAHEHVETLIIGGAHAGLVRPPIRCGVAVTGLRRYESGREYIARTSAGAISANNVVIATGPYQRPVVPDLLPDDCDLFQVHSNAYKGPNQLPPGAVL